MTLEHALRAAVVAAALAPAATAAQEVASAPEPQPAAGVTLSLSVRAGVSLAGGELAPGRDAGDHLGVSQALTGDIGVRWSRFVLTAFLQNHFGAPAASTGVDLANAAAGGVRLALEPWRGDCWSPWFAGALGVAGASASRGVDGRSIMIWSSKGVALIADAGLDRAVGGRFAVGLVASAAFARLLTEDAYDANGDAAGSSSVRASYRLLSIAARVRY